MFSLPYLFLILNLRRDVFHLTGRGHQAFRGGIGRDDNSDYHIAHLALGRWRIRLSPLRHARSGKRIGPRPYHYSDLVASAPDL